jgi:hypothetical protein
MKTAMLKVADGALNVVGGLMFGAVAAVAIASEYVSVNLMMSKKKNDGRS